jgi:hypothetical protein
MGQVFSLNSERQKRVAQRGFREWRRLFQSITELTELTRWSDLPDDVILFFCEETPESKHSFYDLLMSVHHDGNGHDFETQAFDRLTTLLNAFFFITDQAHFECMRRLGWIESIPRGDCSIIEVVLDSRTYEYTNLMETPPPTPEHPAYEEDVQGRGIDRAALVRKHTPEAVRLFKERVGRGCVPAM